MLQLWCFSCWLGNYSFEAIVALFLANVGVYNVLGGSEKRKKYVCTELFSQRKLKPGENVKDLKGSRG